MGLQVSSIVKVKWLSDGDAVDAMGSAWVKTFAFDDLPDLVTIPSDVAPSNIRAYIEGRYGYQVKSWSFWSAVQEASRFADNLYSGDPV